MVRSGRGSGGLLGLLAGQPSELGDAPECAGCVPRDRARALLDRVADPSGSEVPAVSGALRRQRVVLRGLNRALSKMERKDPSSAGVARYVAGVVLRVLELHLGPLPKVEEPAWRAAGEVVAGWPVKGERGSRLAAGWQPHLLELVEHNLFVGPGAPVGVAEGLRAEIHLLACRVVEAVARSGSGGRGLWAKESVE